MRTLSRALRLGLCAATLLLTPATGGYRAFALATASAGRSAPGALPGSAAGAAGLGAPARGLGLDSVALEPLSLGLGAPLAEALPVFEGAAALPAAAAAVSAAETPGAAAVRAALAAEEAILAAPAARAADLSADVGEAIEAAGPVAQASPAAAHGLGVLLLDILTGDKGRPRAMMGAAGGRGVRSGDGFQFGRPAGGSIERSVQGRDPADAEPPRPAAPVGSGQPSRKGPLWPRLVAAALALLPAVFLGQPLVQDGQVAAYGALMHASVFLAMLPFLGPRTWRWVRALPGLSLMALGGIAAFAGAPYVGAAVLVGGLGLLNFGWAKEFGNDYETTWTLSAFFGALAAITAAGLDLLYHPSSNLREIFSMPLSEAPRTALFWLSGAGSLMLLAHLPRWVGAGIWAVLDGFLASVDGAIRVGGALKNDTVLFKRLARYTEARFKRSPWNLVKIGGLWALILAEETAAALVFLAAGLAMGIVLAPLMFAWGVAHRVSPGSKAARFFAGWVHAAFDDGAGSKKSLFNEMQVLLIPHANSANPLVSVPAALGIRLFSLIWLVMAVVATPMIALAGWMDGLREKAASYDPIRHSPAHLHRVLDNDRPLPLPELPTSEDSGRDWLPPQLIATGLAALPLWFLGRPMWSQYADVGTLYMGAGLALAALPWMSERTPAWLRRSAGTLLALTGIAAAAATLLVLPLSAAAASPILWAGALALLAGWGYSRFAAGKSWAGEKGSSINAPIAAGTFLGALGTMAGLGAALLGLGGGLGIGLMAAGAAASILLLIHLPVWLWAGLGGALLSPYYSVKALYRVLDSWRKDTKMDHNLDDHAEHWLKKSVWNGSWLFFVNWLPRLVMWLGEVAVSLAVGLALGLLRAPLTFLWAALYEAGPTWRATRFVAGFARSWMQSSEDSKDHHDELVGMFEEAMNRRRASGWPRLTAWLALLATKMFQFAWMLSWTLGAPFVLATAVWDGFQNARGPARTEPWPADDALRFLRG